MELEQLKSNFNLLGYIEQHFNTGKKTKTGESYLLSTCPICNSTSSKREDRGHFLINTRTNSYSSFSGCCKGGSVIDFFIEAERTNQRNSDRKTI